MTVDLSVSSPKDSATARAQWVTSVALLSSSNVTASVPKIKQITHTVSSMQQQYSNIFDAFDNTKPSWYLREKDIPNDSSSYQITKRTKRN
jgi:hypothetical protein